MVFIYEKTLESCVLALVLRKLLFLWGNVKVLVERETDEAPTVTRTRLMMLSTNL